MEEVLKDLSLNEEAGHCIAFLGNNGAGKSTFLKCLNRILEPQGGFIAVDGLEIKNSSRTQIARKLAYVEQRTEMSRLTVYDTVLLGRKPYMRFAPVQNDYDVVDAAIARMQLEKLKLRYIDELSGGELQKVVLARALAQQPKVLLLDEPTASLDLRNQHEVMKIVAQIARDDGISAVIVIHDLNLALKYCDRFLMLREGEAYCYGDRDVVNPESIRAVYGVETVVTENNGERCVMVL
jgi:iron complex transport system ATP-binding protein